MAYVLTDAHVRRTLTRLARQDAAVGAAVRAYGIPSTRRMAPGFISLLRMIVGQQVSTKAASSIFTRLMAALGSEDPARLLRVRPATLQKAGLSRAKVDYARALAHAVSRGSLDLAGLERLDDQTVIEQLTAIKGIGLWTAQIYLMFCLGRPDIWPRGDLGVQVGLQRIQGLPERPTAAQGETLVARFAPQRSAVALLAWRVVNAPPA